MHCYTESQSRIHYGNQWNQMFSIHAQPGLPLEWSERVMHFVTFVPVKESWMETTLECKGFSLVHYLSSTRVICVTCTHPLFCRSEDISCFIRARIRCPDNNENAIVWGIQLCLCGSNIWISYDRIWKWFLETQKSIKMHSAWMHVHNVQVVMLSPWLHARLNSSCFW